MSLENKGMENYNLLNIVSFNFLMQKTSDIVLW